jgi:hydroxyquinol 1,2-dioxygenase
MPFVTEANLTDIARERWHEIPDPRLRKIMTSLVKHIHAFVREIEPTEAEWATAIDWLTRTGKSCSDKRQEFILFSDVLGVSMLVDAINHRLATGATPTTVTGPFHIHGSPEFADGANMAEGAPGVPCFVSGVVSDLNGRPIEGAILDVWQTDGEGLYEAQRDLEQPWLRGVYHTKADGSFLIRTVVPIGYTIPMDGPVGELMKRTDISHYRPAHIHFLVEAQGYHRIITHLFRRGDQYLDSDVVYGVKEPLIVDFHKRAPGRAPTGEMLDIPFYEVKYNFVLQTLAQTMAA